MAPGERPAAPRWVSLQIRVVPSLDPAGNPWKIQLLERRDETNEVFADEPAPGSRNLELKVIEKRSYLLRLRTGDGDIWFTDSEPFEAGSAMAVRRLEPKAESVRGLVTIGKRPLAKARLTFGTEAGLESISLTSKEDGTFEGFLPRLGRWHVAAASESPHLHREVDADVIHSDRGAGLDVEIRLIPTGLEGEIVDVNGERILKAILQLDGPLQDHRSERVESGTFRFDRLNEGDNFVHASSAYKDDEGKSHLLRSEIQDVTVEDGMADPAWLRVVLLKEVRVKGRVVSSAGAGVSGANVCLVGGRAGAGVPISSVRSDADGRFSVPVPEGTSGACVAVIPKSFSARLTRLQGTDDEQDLPVSGLGGTLLVDSLYWDAKPLERRMVVVFHSGCTITPALFEFIARGSRADTGDRWKFTIPNVEPGQYSVCAVSFPELALYAGGPATFEPCVHGVLAPGALLELKLLP
ncbi:MAG TPA: carboxypeptidase-like regulatory domain-containing protein [Thermoanaerobaculia bacterium]